MDYFDARVRRAEEKLGSRTIALALGLATALLYARVLGFEFFDMDDPEHLLQNPQVFRGLTAEGLRWAFHTTLSGNWIPLTWISQQAAFSLFGAAPAGHHALSVLLHVANVLLVFALLSVLTGRTRRSACAAALFALHPLRIESVAWVAERKDVLCAFFGLTALCAYVAYARRGGALRYAGVLALFACGLLAKSMLVTLPVVLLLLDVWPLQRTRWPIRWWREGNAPGARRRGAGFLLAEKAPLFALSLAIGAATAAAQREHGALVPLFALSVPQRLANAALALASYLGQTLWPPAPLSVFYRHPYLFGGPEPSALAIAGSLALIGLVTAVVARCWRTGYAPLGWLWFLVMLAPTSGLMQVGIQAMANRYTYLPSIGLSLMLVWGGADLLARLPVVGPERRRRLAAALALAVLALCAVSSWHQLGYWRDSVSLFERSLVATRGDFVVRQNLGRALERRGRFEEAVGAYRRALAEAPQAGPAALGQAHGILYYHLGRSLQQLGRAEEAREALRRAVALVPEYEDGPARLAALERDAAASDAPP